MSAVRRKSGVMKGRIMWTFLLRQDLVGMSKTLTFHVYCVEFLYSGTKAVGSQWLVSFYSQLLLSSSSNKILLFYEKEKKNQDSILRFNIRICSLKSSSLSVCVCLKTAGLDQ